MVISPAKVVKDAEWYLEKDERYFLREYDIVKEIKKNADTASKLHGFAKENDIEALLKLIESELNSLERRERWQQIRARYPKLKSALNELLELPMLSDLQKKKIGELLPVFRVWEGSLLVDTVKKLDPLIRGKNPNQVDWKEVQKITAKLEQDLQALVAVDRQLRQVVIGN